jgi:uracil-DNA glycosylase
MRSWNELKWWTSNQCVALHEKLDWSAKTHSWSPSKGNVYRALHETHFPDVKVVIVGQDPYHTLGMATGLAFSVPAGLPSTKFPPSLKNIFRELSSDLHIPSPTSGDLTPWARRGVLLWNSCLTVETGRAGSHRDIGWEALTDEVLRAVDEYHHGVVFVLWGRDAQRHLPTVLSSVQDKRNHVILSSHPSPLSAHQGFLGSCPFSTINGLLKEHALDWRL